MKDKDGIPASTNTKVAIEIKRTRRTPTQLFTDAVKERKDEIASLEAQLVVARKDYADFVETAKAAMEL